MKECPFEVGETVVADCPGPAPQGIEHLQQYVIESLDWNVAAQTWMAKIKGGHSHGYSVGWFKRTEKTRIEKLEKRIENLAGMYPEIHLLQIKAKECEDAIEGLKAQFSDRRNWVNDCLNRHIDHLGHAMERDEQLRARIENLEKKLEGEETTTSTKNDGMNPAELKIIDQLADVFSAFNELEQSHQSDAEEFATSIHVCQNIVMSRLDVRTYPEFFGKPK